MKMREDIRPVTYLKSKAADLLAQLNKTRRPVVITQKGEARAVLQDPDSFEEMRAAIGLLKLLAQGEQDVREGRTLTQDEVFRELRGELTASNRRRGRRA